MSDKVKKQHYVWEHYLKGWATKNQIWCKRGSSIFPTSTENVGQERYFYEIDPLNQSELNLLRNLVLSLPESTHFLNMSSLRAYSDLAASTDHHRRFGLEWFHSQIEGKVANVLEELRSGNAQVLEDSQSKIDLCIYMGHQYTRTKKALNSFASLPATTVIPDCYKEVNFLKIHRATAFILANGIGNSIYDVLDLHLIENETETKLLTCDQPVYNLLAIPGEISKESSIYMPINSTFALRAKKGDIEKIDTKEKAANLNAFMVKNSWESIFSQTKEELDLLIT